MNTLKQTLFTGWHFMRWLRLAFGVFFLVQAVLMHDTLIGVVGGFFLFTAVTNTGCCGAGSCATPVRKVTEREPQEINFEEVKSK